MAPVSPKVDGVTVPQLSAWAVLSFSLKTRRRCFVRASKLRKPQKGAAINLSDDCNDAPTWRALLRCTPMQTLPAQGELERLRDSRALLPGSAASAERAMLTRIAGSCGSAARRARPNASGSLLPSACILIHLRQLWNFESLWLVP